MMKLKKEFKTISQKASILMNLKKEFKTISQKASILMNQNKKCKFNYLLYSYLELTKYFMIKFIFYWKLQIKQIFEIL